MAMKSKGYAKAYHGKIRSCCQSKGRKLVKAVEKSGLYANIAAKRRRIKAGSGEKMLLVAKGTKG